MKQTKTRSPGDRFHIAQAPDWVYRLKNAEGVIVAVGNQSYCKWVQARRPGTTIEVF